MQQYFDSFFQAGFECSSHRRRDGVRLDLIRATSHDKHVAEDYAACARLGFRTLRDGLRWHLIERAPGTFDWSSWRPALEAAEEQGLQVIWDLFHYGLPDHLDLGDPDFPERFADFGVAAIEQHQSISGRPAAICPLNEINFMAWAIEGGYFPQTRSAPPGGFKAQLVQAAILASKAIKREWPDTLITGAEPLIHIAPHDRRRRTIEAAAHNLRGMYEAYDWILGLARPELGGDASLIDVMGWNYYPHNQWYFEGPTVPMGHHEYRSLAEMLVELGSRYQKPLFISETGAEGSGKPSWLHYVCSEVRDAIAGGADINGICWYPITAYPGWDNSRHADAGLLSTIVADGNRLVDDRLYAEFRAQSAHFFGGTLEQPRVVGGARR